MLDPDEILPKRAIKFGAALTEPLFDLAISLADFTPRQKEILEKAKKGLPLGGVLGVSRKERDALFAHACRLLQGGQQATAHDLLRFLFVLHPTDARVLYALAMTLQIAGLHSRAAGLYLFFIALDATNPDGHLRMAECLLSMKSLADVRSHLLVALRYAKTPEQKFLAQRLMASVEDEKPEDAAPQAAGSGSPSRACSENADA